MNDKGEKCYKISCKYDDFIYVCLLLGKPSGFGIYVEMAKADKFNKYKIIISYDKFFIKTT